jgi:hypothetical protein
VYLSRHPASVFIILRCLQGAKQRILGSPRQNEFEIVDGSDDGVPAVFRRDISFLVDKSVSLSKHLVLRIPRHLHERIQSKNNRVAVGRQIVFHYAATHV